MHIYSIVLRFGDRSELNKAEAIIADWVSQKARRRIFATELWEDPRRDFGEDVRVDVWRTLGDPPAARAFRLTHPDARVAGRQWVTEVGVREDRTSGDRTVSLLLRTEESSALVTAPVQVTRPKVVADLIRACRFASYVPGADVKSLTDGHGAEALRYVIADEHRNYAVVLVSAAENGRYLVDLSRLSWLLAGVAEVVQIPADADTFAIGDVLGNQFRSWLGAINVIFPPVPGLRSASPPNRKLMPLQIEEMIANGVAVENEILSIVTHRTNLLNARAHVSPTVVQSLSAREALEISKKQAAESGQSTEYATFLEREVVDFEEKVTALLQKKTALEETLFAAELRSEELEQELAQARYQVESLKLRLRPSDQQELNIEHIRSSVLALVLNTATPEQILQLVVSLYPDRLVVLDSAWKSARDAAKFDQPKELFELLKALADQYWTDMVGGKGDTEARKVFGRAYSARESESVEANHRARRLRTFDYKGVPTEMMRHIKIGVKDSKAETMRLHFYWDAVERRIAIGHCGRHLDHN